MNTHELVKSDFTNLGLAKLDDKTLVFELKKLVKTERKIMVDVLSHIREVEKRRLYFDYDCSSLFEFLTDEIGYTSGPAQARIDASRLLGQIPEIKKDFESGALNLSQSSMIASSVRQKEKEVKSRKLSVDQKKELVDLVKNKNLDESQVLIAKTLDIKIKKSDKKSLQQDKSVRIEMTLSEDQMAQVTRVKELISHINPNPSMGEILEFLANDYIKRKDPLAKKVANRRVEGAIPKVTAESAVKCKPAIERNAKSIKAKDARFIYQRDQKCQWELNETQVCGSRFQLQIDHKKPRWQGGENTTDNLQLLCRVHNILKYKREST